MTNTIASADKIGRKKIHKPVATLLSAVQLSAMIRIGVKTIMRETESIIKVVASRENSIVNNTNASTCNGIFIAKSG